MVEINKRKIKCSIFSAREKIIQDLNYDIWRADLSAAEIEDRARALRSEAELLSRCPKNDGGKRCKVCRAICDLRIRTAIYITGEGKAGAAVSEPFKIVEV